jgi:hypothetical protein
MRKSSLVLTPVILIITLGLSGVRPAMSGTTQLIVNGGFESGLTGWTTLNQPGSAFGGFELQSGTLSPVSFLPVPAPPQGTHAAMEDALGPIATVLGQSFVVPRGITSATLSFDLYLNSEGAPWTTPGAPLDYRPPSPNQQVRVDILTQSADPFAVSPAAGVLENFFQTTPSTPTVLGYETFTSDVTSLLQAHEGQTLFLRDAVVHNLFDAINGSDAWSVVVTTVPEPNSFVLLAFGGVVSLATAAARWRRRRTAADRRLHDAAAHVAVERVMVG